MEDKNLFLSGQEVNTSLVFRPEFSKLRMRDRDQALLDHANSKSILHVGFLDHSATVRDQKGKSWLHNSLNSKSSRLFGLDIEEDQIEALASQGIMDLHTWATLPVEIRFDSALVPDVIEHVENVGDFLRQIHGINSSVFVFSTPNGLGLGNRTRMRTECINSDHLQLFTPWTLEAALFRAGFGISKLEMCDVVNYTQPLRTMLKFFFPLLRGNMVAFAFKLP